MKKENIIDELIVRLKEHNENYVEGAWENFKEKQKKKKRGLLIFYIASGMAASFFVAHMGISHLKTENIEINNSYSESYKEAVIANEDEQKRNSNELKNKTLTVANNKEYNLEIVKPEISNKTNDNNVLAMDVSYFTPLNSNDNDLIESNFIDSLPVFQLNNAIDNTAQIIKINQKDQNKKIFNFGLIFKETTNSTPSSSNIAYAIGIVNDIKLNSKISFNTGVILGNYNLNYTSEPAMFGTQEEPISTKVELMCFDIPFNLKFDIKEINKSEFFIVSGVSTLAFMREKYYKEYMFGKQEVTSHHFENINFSGQFNFSCGWQYTMSNNMHLSIETYAKLPLYKLAEDNIQFYQTGISLSISK